MTRNVLKLLRSGLAVALALSLGTPVTALADADENPDATQDIQLTAYELQQEVEERSTAYAEAREAADAASAAVEENQDRIDELERQIPAQQKRSAQAAREMYKLQQQSAGLIDLLLSADSFGDFLAELEYVNQVSDAIFDEMTRVIQLKNEIVKVQDDLRTAQQFALAKANDARDAMEAALVAQAEVQRRIEEEARAQAEIAAMAAALAEQERTNDEGAPVGESSTGKGGESSSDVSGDAGSKPAEQTVEATPSVPDMTAGEAAFVSEWAPRIDAYLAGSPLAGQGTTFAQAAYKYGVDPRFSPAISFTESSKGLYCFLPHNAWGWGSSSWPTWEEAINDHVAGLARGYGGQISVEGAKKYCPPNWQTWYNRTLGQMEMI